MRYSEGSVRPQSQGHEGIPATTSLWCIALLTGGASTILLLLLVRTAAGVAPSMGGVVLSGMHSPRHAGYQGGGGASIATLQLLDAFPVVQVVG